MCDTNPEKVGRTSVLHVRFRPSAHHRRNLHPSHAIQTQAHQKKLMSLSCCSFDFSKKLRSKGFMVKHAVRVSLSVCVGIWLLYQVKHSRDKKVAVIKLGRKDLNPGVEDPPIQDIRHEPEEGDDEKDNMHGKETASNPCHVAVIASVVLNCSITHVPPPPPPPPPFLSHACHSFPC